MGFTRSWLAVMAVIGVIGLTGTVLLLHRNSTPSALQAIEEEESLFQDFIQRFGRNYSSEEYSYRFKVFRDNLAYARVHNSQSFGYTLGVNKFTDLTNAEFKAMISNTQLLESDRCVPMVMPSGKPPTAINWASKGAVTPVMNQGQCGSCWAFSVVGSVEALHFLKTGNLVPLSVQQILDCSSSGQGCNGGSMVAGFSYVIGAGGLESAAEYPYTGTDGKCHADKSKFVAHVTGCQVVPTNNEKALEAAVAQHPVSAGVEADQMSWQMYFGGIISSNCGTNIDHGVVIVGYGLDGNNPYWLVKNSWGAEWGINGYVKIKKDLGSTDGGMCGIAKAASFPTN